MKRELQRLCIVGGLAWSTTLLAGCLNEPGIEERWTDLEIVAASKDGSELVDYSAGETLSLDARVNYRSILTGALVAELRASGTIDASMVNLEAGERQIGAAADIDFILANSVTAGRDFHSVTGFPQLVQEISFSFDSFRPAGEALRGPISGLFLVLYMGDEDEIELSDGSDSTVITPFDSRSKQLLHKGIAIPLTLPTP